MPEQIAVIQAPDGLVTTIYEDARLVIYQKHGCQCNGYQWQPVREKPFSLDRVQSMKDLRERMAEAIDFIGDCRVLVTLAIGGVPYFELEKAGFTVWEMGGHPEDHLDQIALQDTAAIPDPPEEESLEIHAPQEVFPGCYRISLREIQQNHTRVTSKQILLPFLHHGDFHSLEILCDHIPPWLEEGLITGQYFGSIENCGRSMAKITITGSRGEGIQPNVARE